MNHLTLLLFILLWFSCGDAVPKSTPEPVIIAPATEPLPDFVPAPDPVYPPIGASMFSDFAARYAAADLTDIRFTNCYFVANRPPNASPSIVRDTFYPTTGRNTLAIRHPVLFVREIRPNDYLIALEYEELQTYVDLIRVDSLLNKLGEVQEINCGDFSALEILSTVFLSDTVYESSVVEYLENLNDSTELFRRFTRQITLLPEGKTRTKIISQSYFAKHPPTDLGEPGPDYTPELMEHSGERYALPANEILPDNSVGVVYLEAVLADAYRVSIRFPGINTEYMEALLGIHFAQPNENGNQYTTDMILDVAPPNITVYDTFGQTITIDTLTRLKLRFYCENDGPMITDATYDLTIPKKAYPGNLEPLNRDKMGAIAAVAVTGFNATSFKNANKKDNLWPNEEKVMAVHARPGEQLLANFLFVWDEAEDDLPCYIFSPSNLVYDFDLSCCGP